jgi:DNA polymerase-3 subunit epsilon
MREIVLDTETTGLDPNDGHRVVEIGCVELMHHVPTGRHFHRYIDPERDMPPEAFAVHGLSAEFLSQHPIFEAHVEELLDFLGDAPLIIHNAGFDMKFLNAELRWCHRPALPMARAVDTVGLARRRFPGAQVSLDALCRRFEIDNSHRSLHGALLDAQLLAEVYLELIGGKEPGFDLANDRAGTGQGGSVMAGMRSDRPRREPRPHAAGEAELAAHKAFLAELSDPIWLRES